MSKKIRNDIILIGSILLISIISIVLMFVIPSNDNLYAEVYKEDKFVCRISLDQDVTYSIDNTNMKVEVIDGKLRVIEADCHDKICVNQGFISMTNQTITCLPNKVYIVICSLEEGVDSIV